MFPKRLHLYLPNGKDKYQTGYGFFFTGLIWLFMLIFVSYAIGELVDSGKKNSVDVDVADPVLQESILPGIGRATHV